MEALTALGVAAAVVQFIDFGSRITKDGIAAYKSTAGLSEQHVELNDIAYELQAISRRLATGPVPGQTPTQDEQKLHQLATECQQIADELANLLSKLKVTARGPARSWVAVCKALRLMLKNKRLTEIRQQLEDKRQRAQTLTLSILRDTNSRINLAVNDLSSQMQQLHINDADRLRRHVDQLLASMLEMKQAATSNDVLLDIATRLKSLEDQLERTDRTVTISETLGHRDLFRREQGIADSYEGTYDWLFPMDKSPFRPTHPGDQTWPARWHGFDDWLRAGSGIYWITGKAGSGKSCLMKHIQNNLQTSRLLAQWSSGSKLIVANHYFWRAGTKIQRSQRGLLRWLLLQVFKHSPHLVKQCSPNRWSQVSAYGMHGPWSWKELAATLGVALKHASSTKICVFIDGLDEYEESEDEGSHYDLVQYLAGMQCSDNIKICISSRPWLEFREAYSEKPHLTLQEWTRKDISTYVSGKLEEDPRFLSLNVRDAGAATISRSLAQRAEGVFLWVRLVTASLLRGLSKKDSVQDLHKRLDLLPADLEEYFQHMLNSIEEIYHERAACLLLLLACPQPHNPCFLPEFIDKFFEQGEDVNKSLTDELKLPAAWEKNQDLLDAWCPDLLTLTGSHNRPVEISFAHRSLFDFVRSTKVQVLLSARMQRSMRRTHLEAMAHLYAFKRCLTLGITEQEQVDQLTQLDRLLFSVEYLDAVHLSSVFDGLISSLDRCHNHPFVVAMCSWYSCERKDLRVHLAIDRGLIEYLDTFYEGPWDSAHLSTACRVWLVCSRGEMRTSFNLEFIRRLLRRGPHPESRKQDHSLSVWQEFLISCERITAECLNSETADVALLLIEYGASATRSFRDPSVSMGRHTINTMEVLQKLSMLKLAQKPNHLKV